MKRIIKSIFAIILSLVSLVSVYACTSESNSAENPVNPENPSEILFADFEEWVPDFQLCRISNYFGKVSMNADEKYVHEGKRSARIDPVGNGWMYFSTKSETFGFDYTDFTHVDCIRLEMYNPQTTNDRVSIGLVSEPYALDQFTRAGGKEFTLKPGWNTLNYYIEPMLVNLVADLSNISGIYMIFDPLFEYEITDETPKYYVDNIRIRYMEEAHTTESSFEFGVNEIMDFEKFYQSNFYINEQGIDMKIIKPSDFGVNATSGSKALRMVIPGSGSGLWKYHFEIMGAYIRKSALGSLTKQQFENGYFCWDIYNGSDSVYNIVAIFENATAKNEYKLATFPASGEWTTFRVKLTDIETAVPGWKDNVGSFILSVLENQNVDRELILDNVRLEFDS